MTINERLISYMEERGLFTDQAEIILDRFKNLESSKALDGRWNDTETGYPEALMTSIIVSLNHVVIEWINEHCPKAWYRELFC